MDKSFRIRTEIGKDKVIHVNLQQDYSFLEILSLKLNQIDNYKLHVSNYGVLVGRVVANGNFGIPNVKLSVFIPLDENDSLITEIKNLYPYESTHDKNSDNLRYNLLSDYSNDDCYRVIGSFPNKRLVLDNDTYIEVFDKYYKYTTVTNKSGDYMIPFVPCGTHEIHSDLDLSDIGILSQKPIDLMYKGYNETQFDNPRQFKEGDNLNNLVQVISQNNTVEIYPFWGDSSMGEIAISRCDIEIQYKFEPTCVFFGSIISDNFNNAIGHKCSPSKYSGFNRHLVTGEGTIEMIRKTPDNLVEEYQIQGNRLIDGDGVWCYQIPMNLDYVGTDEFGNIVPTDNPNKGIPTRTSVRFRFSMQETSNEGVSRHRAKYLVPNVQDIIIEQGENSKQEPFIKNASQFDKCYEFGSATPDEYFRDLYWNKVYSVKNYIPRLQTNGKKNNQNYSAIKSVNSNNNLNPLPYNHARYRLVFAYRVLCMIMTIVIYIICIINTFFGALACLCIKIPVINKKICPFRPIVPSCIGFSGGLTEDEDNNNEYFPCCPKCGEMECDTPGCTKITDKEELINTVQQTLAQEYDTVNLDFYNDWLNGSLYMPLWFWKKTKKKKYFFGLFSKKAVNTFCNCDKNFPKLRVTENCSLSYKNDYSENFTLKDKKYHNHYPSKKTFTIFGVIKEFITKSGLNVYYYAPGIPNNVSYKNGFDKGEEDISSYVRLYSTDIILLGSLNSCDLDNYPNVFSNLPSTTANVPFISTIKQSMQQEDGATYLEDTSEEKGYTEITGMDWLHEGEDGKPKYGAGLFIDLACNAVYTKPKSCINVARLSELGVSYDMYSEEPYSKNNKLETNIILADGLITRYEIVDHETRAMFASLNNNGLKEKIYNPNTGYETYKLKYIYPNDFDGHLKKSALNYTSMMDFKTFDNKNQDYIDYRFGLNTSLGIEKIPYYASNGDSYTFPLFNNSFYFYFGLNEGKTAIDKFNKKFYATCYKNEKYPFTFDLETSPAEWCVGEDGYPYDEYARIIIKFNTIKMPYSYTLYNEFNEELISESGIMLKELKFGYEVKEGEYTENRDGRLQYILTDEVDKKYVKKENGDYICLENGIYTLKIVDASGNEGKQKIMINQLPINIEYETIGLGNKYYFKGENKSVVEDFCNDNNFYGEIRIKTVIIDGNEYEIISCNGGGNEYTLNVIYNGIIKEVLLEIIPTESNFDDFYNQCTCKGVNGIQTYKIIKIDGKNVLIFHVWVPQNYDLIITEICSTNPIPNTTKLTVSVLNGKPFNLIFNDVPVRLILGKNEEYNNYNTNLNKNLYANDVEMLPFWFYLHDESKYNMPKLNYYNYELWSDFINISTELIDDEGTIEDLTIGSRMSIMKYKFESLFNLSKTCYIVDDGESYMEISYSGGKKPYVKRGVYPTYDNVLDDNTIDEYLYDCQGYVAAEYAYPNIITYNYTYLDDNMLPNRLINYPPLEAIPNIIDFNQLINDYKKQGNYFAAFTSNGGYDSVCIYNKNNKYQQYPYFASPYLDSLKCISGENKTSYVENKVYTKVGINRPYFRGLFLDKRLDYSFFIMTPYASDDIAYIGDDDSWKYGYISGVTYNGVSMAYDSLYNIIGDNINEYEYSYEGYDNGLSDSSYNEGDDFKIKINTTPTVKRFYTAELKLGNQTIDIRNDFMIGYTTTDDEGNQIIDTKLKYPEVRKIGNEGRKNFDFTFDKLEFKVENCSYDIDLTIEDDGEKQYITGATQNMAETSFSVSCDKTIDIQLPTLEECATNNSYNVLFIKDGNYFVSKLFLLATKIKNDTRNSTHSVYTYIPRLFNVKPNGSSVNNLNELKKQKTIKDIRKVLDKNTLDFFDVQKGSDEDLETSSWKPKIGRLLNNNDLLNGDRHWKGSNSDSEIIFDDSKEVRNVIYTKGSFVNNKVDIIGVLFFRNYLNTSGDNLTKEIVTLQTAAIFDIRKFILSGGVCEVKMLDNVNSETEGNVSVPTVSQDNEGNVSTGSKNEDINASTTSETKVQYTEIKLTWIENDINFNQQFVNYEKLVAIFKLDGNKMTSTVNIVLEGTSTVKFEIYWNGDLEGEFLDSTRNASLFIQMPNKMIYLLNFKIACNGNTVLIL